MSRKVFFLVTLFLILAGGALYFFQADTKPNGEENIVLAMLCNQKTPFPNSHNHVYKAIGGQHYASLSYIELTGTPEGFPAENVLTDSATNYYDSDGNLLSSCGGFRVESSESSFCENTLPNLDFNFENNLCDK